MKFSLVPVSRSGWQKTAIRLGSVVLALALASALLSVTGKSPWLVLSTMWGAAFGSWFGFSETLLRMTPLVLCGLGVAVAARMQLWNIGAEGQFHLGAIAATGVALAAPGLPAVILLPLMVLAGAVAGGLWCLVPGAARAYLGTNETITTLLLNYVAINIMNYLVYGPWKDPKGFNFPLTAPFSEGATLPLLAGASSPLGRVHVGLIVALLAAVAVWLVLRSTRWGYEIKVIGQSPATAKYAGMSIAKNILLVMFVSGALAGLAGMMEVSGVLHKLQKDISPGYGYTAIIVAWLAQLNPIALVLVAFLFGGLQAGGYSVQSVGVPLATVYMIQGVILFGVLGAEIFTKYRLVRTKPAAASAREEVA